MAGMSACLSVFDIFYCETLQSLGKEVLLKSIFLLLFTSYPILHC